MKISEIIALSGILLTFIVSLLSLVVSLKQNSKNRYANLITDIRTAWLSNLRLYISEFIRFSILCLDETEKGKLSDYYANLIKYAYISRTHLGDQYEDISRAITNIEDYVSQKCGTGITAKSIEGPLAIDENLFYQEIANLEKSSINCFSSEWQRMRNEAKGKIKSRRKISQVSDSSETKSPQILEK